MLAVPEHTPGTHNTATLVIHDTLSIVCVFGRLFLPANFPSLLTPAVARFIEYNQEP